MKRCIRFGVLAGMMVLAFSAQAFAGGGEMPWDSVFDTLAKDITTKVVGSIGMVAVVILGISMAMGISGDTIKKIMLVVVGLSVAYFSTQIVTTLFKGTTGLVM